MLGATLARRFPSAVGSDRVTQAEWPSSLATLRSNCTSSLMRWWSFTSSDRCRSVRSRHHRSPFRLADCSVGGFTAGLFGLNEASQPRSGARRRLSTNLPLCYEDFSTRLVGRRIDCGKLVLGAN